MAPRNPARSALEHQAPHATRRIEGTIRVRATVRGFYDNHVKEPGDVFTIQSQKELGKWMERVEDETAEQKPAGERAGQNEQTVTTEQPAKGLASPAKGVKKGEKAEPVAPAPATKPENDVL